MAMAPPNRRRSILKQKNNDDETENFRNDPEESQWANVTQSARKRVSFSAKNQVKEFAKNCSSDNSNLSSDMDMTVCRERSMHEQNGDFDDELQNSAMEITTHPAAANNSSPESNATTSSPHVFITPALKGTALSKSSVSFVTSTPAASSSPMLVTPKMAKRTPAEDTKITPISHPCPVEPDSVEKGRTIANQSMGRSNMSVTCLKSPEHTVYGGIDMSIIQEAASVSAEEEVPLDMLDKSGRSSTKFSFGSTSMDMNMSYEDQNDRDNEATQRQQNSRRKTTFEPADMSVCEETKNAEQDTVQHQRNARRKTTFEHADMSVCEEAKRFDQDTDQHQTNARRKTTFEHADMSVCEEPKNADQDSVQHNRNARRQTTFEHADMSVCEEPKKIDQDTDQHHRNGRRLQNPVGESPQHENPADRTKIFEMSMEMSFGTEPEESETSPIQTLVASNSQQPRDALPNPVNLESKPAEVTPVALPNSKLKVAGPLAETTARKMATVKVPTQSLGWLSDPAFAPKIYSKSTLATGQMAAAAAPSVPSVTHFGKFGCAKTPKRLIPMDLLSAEMLAGLNEENKEKPTLQQDGGTPKVAEKPPARRPQKRGVPTTADAPAPTFTAPDAASQCQRVIAIPTGGVQLPPTSNEASGDKPPASSDRGPEAEQATLPAGNLVHRPKTIASPILPPVGFVEMESPKAPPAKKPALALASTMQERPDVNEDPESNSNFSPARRREKIVNKAYLVNSSASRNGPSVACVFSKPVSNVTEVHTPKTSPLNTANGPNPMRTASPVAVIQPMNRTYISTPTEASINFPPSQTLPWDTTCALGGELLAKTRMATGFKPASPAPVNETFVVDPEADNPVENDDNIFEPSIRFDGTIKEEPENETSNTQLQKLGLTQVVAPLKSLQKTLAELHLTDGQNALQATSAGQDDTQRVAVPDSLQTTIAGHSDAQAQGLSTFEPPPQIPAERTATEPQDVAQNGMNESLMLHRPAPVQRKSSAEQLLEDMEQPEDLTQDLSFGSYVSFAAPPPLNGSRRPSRSISPANSAESLFQSSVMDSPTSPQQPMFNVSAAAAPAAAALPQNFGHSSRPPTHHHREPDPRYPLEVQNLLRIMMNSRGVRKMKAAEKLWRHPAVPLNLQADLYEQLKQYLPSIFCSQDWRY